MAIHCGSCDSTHFSIYAVRVCHSISRRWSERLFNEGKVMAWFPNNGTPGSETEPYYFSERTDHLNNIISLDTTYEREHAVPETPEAQFRRTHPDLFTQAIESEIPW